MTKIGDRVRLEEINDPYTNLRPGLEGEVVNIDRVGTVHVRWDDGHVLGLVEQDGDRWTVLPPGRSE